MRRVSSALSHDSRPRITPACSARRAAIFQATNDFVRAGGVANEVAFAEEREQHNLDAERLHRRHRIAYPGLGARVAFVRHTVEFPNGEAGDLHARLFGRCLKLLLNLRLAELHVIGRRAEADLDAIESNLPGDLKTRGIGELAEGPVAGPDLESAFLRRRQQRGEGGSDG